MQDKNYELNVIIEKQQTLLDQRESVFIDKITSLNEHFSKSLQNSVRVEK